jgi:hypothetical protein
MSTSTYPITIYLNNSNLSYINPLPVLTTNTNSNVVIELNHSNVSFNNPLPVTMNMN